MVALNIQWLTEDRLQVFRARDGKPLREARILPVEASPGLFRVEFVKVDGLMRTVHVPQGYDTANVAELRKMAMVWAEDAALYWPPRELKWHEVRPDGTGASVKFFEKGGFGSLGDRAANVFRIATTPEDHPKPWRIELHDYSSGHKPGWHGGKILWGWDQPTREEAQAIAEEWVRDGVFRWENPRDVADMAWAEKSAGESLRDHLAEMLGEEASVEFSHKDGTVTAVLPVDQAQALADIVGRVRAFVAAVDKEKR